MEFMDRLEGSYSQFELQSAAKILNSSYDPFMPDCKIWEMLCSLFSMDIFIETMNRIVGHQVVNEILLKYYPGERIIKYHFVKEKLGVPDEVTFFEMYVESSRLDVARVNGESYVYEIKTELDTLDKLTRQIEDYSKAFEYIYVIAHEKHIEKAKGIVPDYCGIYTYQLMEKGCDFYMVRPARINSMIDCQTQIKTLSSKSLEKMLRKNYNNVPRTKEERQSQILKQYSPEEINNLFKIALKEKYTARWNYLSQIFNEILPIDIETFFHTQADPGWIYYKNSSIV